MPSRSIRILFFESGRSGGSVRSVSNLIKGLSTLGCEVSFFSHYRHTAPVDLFSIDCVEKSFCLNVPLSERPDVGMRSFGVPHPTFFGLRYFLHSLVVLLRYRPQIVYLNNGIRPHFPALVAAGLLKIPIFCHFRESRGLLKWEEKFIHFIDRFIVLTKWGRELYHSHGIPLKKLQLMYNPLDLETFDERSKEDLNLRFESNAIYVVKIGTLKPQKRPDLAIKAFALAHAECPKLRLILAGDGPMKGELKKLVLQLGLTKSVLLIGQCSQIPALLKHCHIGLLVSEYGYEGLPNVIMESMASSMPFVTWKAPAMMELVEDSKTGLIADDDTPEAIGRALVTLCVSPELRMKMGNEGRKRIEEKSFSPESFMQEMYKMLEVVVYKNIGV